MRSHGILRIALGILALPLCFEATTGCDIVFQLKEFPRDDNAVRCACSCDNAGSVSQAVQTSTDDADQTGATMDFLRGTLDLGLRSVGVRFDGVAIPAGAIIQSAIVQFTAAAGDSGTTPLTISAQQSVSAATFTAADNDLGRRTVGLSVAWTPANWSNGDAGVAQQTPELKDLLQQLVDQPGWSNASAVVLRFDGTGQRRARSFDGNNARAPSSSSPTTRRWRPPYPSARRPTWCATRTTTSRRTL